jgi:polysaccharide export outer membrane protein
MPTRYLHRKAVWSLAMFVYAVCLLSVGFAQVRPAAQPRSGAPETPGANLPIQPIGANDLLYVSVYDAPELTGTVRVTTDGLISLPLLKQRVKAQDLMPGTLEAAIAEALRGEHIIVNPFVKVTVSEYSSHPVSVAGAVNQPTTFQAAGPITLLEAITLAGGLSADAGPEILVTRSAPGPDGPAAAVVQRILVKGLIDGEYPALNIVLHGGEEVRVPAKGKVYVIGNVRQPGAFPMEDTESTVLKMLALSQGLMPYAAKEAYIYRQDGSGNKNELVIPLSKIMERKAADSALLANDVLYVPDRKVRRMSLEALEKVLLLGSGAGAAAIYTMR